MLFESLSFMSNIFRLYPHFFLHWFKSNGILKKFYLFLGESVYYTKFYESFIEDTTINITFRP